MANLVPRPHPAFRHFIWLRLIPIHSLGMRLWIGIILSQLKHNQIVQNVTFHQHWGHIYMFAHQGKCTDCLLQVLVMNVDD